ncbi:MAG: PPC domain-containing protein [Pyrinomonadaceae bacterium]
MKKKIGSLIRWSRTNIALFGLLFGLVAFGMVAFKASAQRSDSGDPKAQQRVNSKVEDVEYSTIELDPELVQGLNRNQPNAGRVNAPAGVGFSGEVEPNGTTATASPIAGSQAVVKAPLYPNGDVDFYSFTANAGDRIYVAAMTSNSAGSSTDSQVTVIASDGTTTLEFDDDNGSFAGLSSTIAGVTIPSNGTYYIKVNDFTAGTTSERPYELYFKRQTAAPTAEVEGNDTPATANPLPASGHVSGARNPAVATEQDWYSLNLNAGDTVFLSLDLDPERDYSYLEWSSRVRTFRRCGEPDPGR